MSGGRLTTRATRSTLGGPAPQVSDAERVKVTQQFQIPDLVIIIFFSLNSRICCSNGRGRCGAELSAPDVSRGRGASLWPVSRGGGEGALSGV